MPDGSFWFGTDGGALHTYEASIEGGHWLDEDTFRSTHSVTSLLPRGPYVVEVSDAFSADGIETPALSHSAFTVDYAGEVADTTPPDPPWLFPSGVVRDPSAVTAYWNANDADSNIIGYRYAIGSTSGGREIVDWTTTTATEVTRTDLGFVEEQTYWFSVQAQNSGGLWSPTATRGFIAGQGAFETHLPGILKR